LKDCLGIAATFIGSGLTEKGVARGILALEKAGLNAPRIRRFSDEAYEILFSAKAPFEAAALRDLALQVSAEVGIDVVLQSEAFYLEPKRLIAFDMDSTLITCEVIDELAREKGVYDEVAAITHAAMMGKLDFNQSLTERCLKLKGLSLDALERVASRIELTPGALELVRALKSKGYKTALISGGFSYFAEQVQKQLSLDHIRANTLEIQNGLLTGKIVPPIVNAQKKAELLEEIAAAEQIPLAQVIAVGDGANDLLMMEKAGLGIAFNAKPAVRALASASLNQKSLRPILYLLGRLR
jgi:phosphoserine phosphatase